MTSKRRQRVIALRTLAGSTGRPQRRRLFRDNSCVRKDVRNDARGTLSPTSLTGPRFEGRNEAVDRQALETYPANRRNSTPTSTTARHDMVAFCRTCRFQGIISKT
jgi:hypothetical protein